MFSATTKKSFIIERAEDTCDILEEAINIAFEGRPGPVHIHIPKDITFAEVPNFREIKLDIKPVLPEDEKINFSAIGKVVRVSFQLYSSYIVHIRFDKLIEENLIEKITGKEE